MTRPTTPPYAWKLWTVDWPSPTPGEHSITSRAVDEHGNVRAAPTDPIVARKKTYWESFGWVTRKVPLRTDDWWRGYFGGSSRSLRREFFS